MRSDIYDLKSIYASPLFRGFDEEQIDSLLYDFPLDIKTYTKGEIIIRQGDSVKKIGIILEGCVMSNKYHYDGTSQLLQVLQKNDILGIEAISSTFLTSPYMNTADDFCIIAFFPYVSFINSREIEDAKKLRLSTNVLNIVSDDSIRKMYKIDVLTKRRLRERILTYLSIISEKKHSKTIDIGMTQDQFAHYLCVNRSVLSKELNMMKREKIIDFRGSMYVIFENNK